MISSLKCLKSYNREPAELHESLMKISLKKQVKHLCGCVDGCPW